MKGPDPGLNITIPWEQVKKNLLPDRVRRRLPGINQYLRPVCQHILPSVFIWLYDNFLSGWCLQNHSEHIGIVFPQLYIQRPLIFPDDQLKRFPFPLQIAGQSVSTGTNVRYIFFQLSGRMTACRTLVSAAYTDCRPPAFRCIVQKTTQQGGTVMRSVTVSVADVDDEWLPDFGSFGKRPGHCAHQLRRMWIAILFLGKLHDQQPRARRSAPQPEIWIAPGSNRRHRRSMSGAVDARHKLQRPVPAFCLQCLVNLFL